ncbi:MAG: GDYXXLXY domain-containing protein [Alphaproteobacteria bacterium]
MTIAIRIIIVLVIQVAVLGGMLGLHLTTLCRGEPVIIMTRNVEAEDIIAGNTIPLRYSIGNIDLSGLDGSDQFRKFDPVYVILRRFENRQYGSIWYADRVENDLEGQQLRDNEIAIRGTVNRVVTNRNRLGSDRPPRIEISYGIEDYRVTSGDADVFGARRGQVDIAMQLLVDSSGRAIVESMLTPTGALISPPSLWTGLCQ